MENREQHRVLVVDDDPNITRLISRTLEAHGYHVRTENCSAQAARIARDFLPDLVLLDVCMPDKDGGDIAQELREHYATAHVPIIFVTSIVSDEDLGGRPDGTIADAHYMPKPVRPRLLAAKVQDTLNSRAMMAQH